MDKFFFNVWTENNGKRGAQEISSCIIKYVQDHMDSNITDLVLYSDCCAGQNRNIKLTLALLKILHSSKHLKSITLRFLVPGHTYMSCDRTFGQFEKVWNKQERVYTDYEVMDLMRKIRNDPEKLTVKKMSRDDFLSTESLEKSIERRTKGTSGEKINWFQIHEISMRSDRPSILYIKENPLSDEVKIRIFLNSKVSK